MARLRHRRDVGLERLEGPSDGAGEAASSSDSYRCTVMMSLVTEDRKTVLSTGHTEVG